MKITIFLLSVILYFNQVNSHSVKVNVEESLKNVEEHIKKSKIKIQDEIMDINRYRNSLQYNFDSTIIAQQKENVKSIRCFTDSLLEKIRIFVEEARIKGKNPIKCFEISHTAITTINVNSYTLLNRCTKEAKEFIERVQTTIDGIISIGQTLTTELNSIFPDCYNHLPKVMLRCANKKIKKLEVRVKNFESSVDSIKTTGKTVFNQGYLHGIACYRDVVIEARENALKILTDAQYCINNS